MRLNIIVFFTLFFTVSLFTGCDRYPVPKTHPSVKSTENDRYNTIYLKAILNADIAENNGNYTLASEEFLNLSRVLKNPELAKEATREALKSNNLFLTIQSVTWWAQLQPNNVLPQYLSSLYILNSDSKITVTPYLHNLFVDSAKEGRNTLLILISELTHSQAKQKLLSALQQMSLQQPNNSELSLTIVILLMELNQHQLALQGIDKILALKPNWLEAMGLKAKILFALNSQQALAYLLEKIKKYPYEINFRSTYASLLLQMGNYDNAKKEYNTLLKLNYEPGDTLIKLGQIALIQKDMTLAESSFEHALKFTNTKTEAQYLLGNFYESKGALDKAVNFYLQVDNGPYLVSAYIKAAVILSKHEQLTKALSLLNRLNPTGPMQIKIIILAKTQILLDAHLFSQALATANDGVNFIPEDTDLLFMRSLAAAKVGNYQNVENDLRKIIKIQPDNALALNALGFTLIENSKRYQEALTYITRALDLKPDDPSILDSLGWTWYRLGNYQNSLRYLRKANSLSADPDIAAHLGEVLWASGNKQEAKDIISKALKDHPESSTLLETIRRIKE